jgi:ketosteroid isomerase-like protein
MSVNAMSRRTLLAAGVGAWFGTSAAANQVSGASNMTNEKLIRAYYASWERKDWGAMDGFLASNFVFSSAAGDDHIDKSAFKAQCWETQAAIIDRFELESVLTNANGTDAFIKYLCRTKKGTSFRNVEYFRLADSKINAIECYFGGHLGYPSAADADKK